MALLPPPGGTNTRLRPPAWTSFLLGSSAQKVSAEHAGSGASARAAPRRRCSGPRPSTQTRPFLEHSQTLLFPDLHPQSPRDDRPEGAGLASQLTCQARVSASRLWAAMSAGSSAQHQPRCHQRPADMPVGKAGHAVRACPLPAQLARVWGAGGLAKPHPLHACPPSHWLQTFTRGQEERGLDSTVPPRPLPGHCPFLRGHDTSPSWVPLGQGTAVRRLPDGSWGA